MKNSFIKKELEQYTITLIDEHTYSSNSTDNLRKYTNQYIRNSKYESICAYGIFLEDNSGCKYSTILLGVGGITSLHENSVAYYNDFLYVVIGDALYSLSLPNLELNWCLKADFASCFGVYYLKNKNKLITWGEVEISCFSITGEKLWNTMGIDIFTEEFKIDKDIATVIDFDKNRYQINLNNGDILKLLR